jgi:hypothetical protein
MSLNANEIRAALRKRLQELGAPSSIVDELFPPDAPINGFVPPRAQTLQERVQSVLLDVVRATKADIDHTGYVTDDTWGAIEEVVSFNKSAITYFAKSVREGVCQDCGVVH